MAQYYQMHECRGLRARVTIEWQAPENEAMPAEWLDKAEEIADQMLETVGPRVIEIVNAMRGR